MSDVGFKQINMGAVYKDDRGRQWIPDRITKDGMVVCADNNAIGQVFFPIADWDRRMILDLTATEQMPHTDGPHLNVAGLSIRDILFEAYKAGYEGSRGVGATSLEVIQEAFAIWMERVR